MVFIIGDIVKIGPFGSYRAFHEGAITKIFSDKTIAIGPDRADPVLFRTVIIGHAEPAKSKS